MPFSLSTASAGTPFSSGTSYLLRDVDVLVHVTDVDVHQNVVRIENRPVRVVVKIDIQHLAIAAPVPAEIDQDALVCSSRSLESGRNFGSCLRGVRIDFAACGVCGAGSKRNTAATAIHLRVFIDGANPPTVTFSVCHKR